MFLPQKKGSVTNEKPFNFDLSPTPFGVLRWSGLCYTRAELFGLQTLALQDSSGGVTTQAQGLSEADFSVGYLPSTGLST